MTDMQAGWDAAVAECLAGHENCTYGGMTPNGGYWLSDTECPLDHGDRCAWCPEPAVTGFAGRAHDGCSIYAVPACQPHADQWAAEHPEWRRRAEIPIPPAEVAETVLAVLAQHARMEASLVPERSPFRTTAPVPVPPLGRCYEASWGWVHVKPGCRCAGSAR